MSENSSLPAKRRRLSRRGFLMVLGVGAAGAYLGIRLATPAIRLRLVEWVEGSGGPPSQIDAPPTVWFEISTDNIVRLNLPKSEMGQGVHTALAQIAADELEIDWEQLEVVHAPTGQGLDDPVGTSASNSVSSQYLPLREAAASLRELLRGEAARRLGVQPVELSAESGRISLISDPSQQFTYGELFQSASEWELPEQSPPIKAQKDFRYIGSAMPRVDLPDKVTGQAVYGFDVRLPGMLYGAVARPETVEGVLKKAGVGKASSQPGVIRVVVEDGFTGVVAESRLQAYQALEMMEIEWDAGRLWQQEEIDAMVTVGEGQGVVIQREGNTSRVLNVSNAVEAEYRTPMAYHAHLEPLAAVADVRADGAQVWASTQAAVRLRGKIAEALKLDEQVVVVTPVYLGGGFGRKVDETVAVDAAKLSQAAGRPVHVGMSRTEDFRNGFLRPPTHHRLRAVLGSNGKLEGFEHQQSSGEVSFPFLPGFMSAVLGADFGSWRGALIPYDIANKETIAYLARLPVYTGWWRGLGLMPNTFALESFMDEMAVAAQADPLEFRLRHLGVNETGVRLGAALQAAADRAGWGESLPAGSGRGIACCYDYGTVVAEVVEVKVEDNDIQVEKIIAAVDPGLIINPDGVEAQTEGAITMGLSSALLEEATLQDGVLQASNFDRYPLLRNSDAPDIDVILLESGTSPLGMGEPPIGPVAAAVANAVFAASGKRLRRLPLRMNSGG